MFKVLVVDDDPNVRLFLERLLTKKFSCTVETAKNGADALSKLKDFDAEVMLLDITMPVMDGVETLTAIRSDDKFKDLAVIVLTAVSEKDTVAKVMQMGVIDYMLKPLLYEHTYTRLKELFDIIRKRNKKKKLMETSDWEDSSSSSSDKKKFLLIFNEDDIRNDFQTKLSELGFEVYPTDNGADGLKLFMKHKPQHIIVGENIPLLNEAMLAQNIKLYEKEHLKIEIVALKSSLDNIKDAEKKIYDLILTKEHISQFFKRFKIQPKN